MNVDPNSFEYKQMKDEFWKALAKYQMDVEVLAAGMSVPNMMGLVQPIANWALAELCERGLMRKQNELLIERIQELKNRPAQLKAFVKGIGPIMAQLPPDVIAAIPAEAFE